MGHLHFASQMIDVVEMPLNDSVVLVAGQRAEIETYLKGSSCEVGFCFGFDCALYQHKVMASLAVCET